MEEKAVRYVLVEWDLTCDDADDPDWQPLTLPETPPALVAFPADLDDEEVAERLSEEYGWLVADWSALDEAGATLVARATATERYGPVLVELVAAVADRHEVSEALLWDRWEERDLCDMAAWDHIGPVVDLLESWLVEPDELEV